VTEQAGVTLNPSVEPALGIKLAAQARRLGVRPFITLPDGTLSYAEMDALSDDVAAALAARGYAAGDVVAVLCGNSIPLVAAWFACAKLGAIFMPVNTLLDGPLLGAVLTHAGARIVLCDGARYPALRAVRAEAPHVRDVIVAAGAAPAGATAFTTFLDEATPPGAAPRPDIDPARPGKLLYTSGTTGQPKGVLWSRACESTHGAAYARELLPIAEGEGLYTCLPLAHVTAQGTVLAALWRGGHVTVDARFDPFRFWARTRAANARGFTFVGTILSVLAQRPPRPDDADNPVEWALGAATPVGAWRAIERRFGLTILETWGQTETASCWTAPRALPQQPGTVGRASPRFEATLRDEQGQEVPPGQIGELWMCPRQPHVMFEGYLHEGDGGAWTADGWYRTGDLMTRTAAGDYSFQARLREAIRRRGELISARAIEEAALTHPAVLEAAAVGVAAPDGVEEEVKLCVVPRAGLRPGPAELSAHLRPLLPAFMRPRYIELRADLPKTASSRVRKFVLTAEGTATSWERPRRRVAPDAD